MPFFRWGGKRLGVRVVKMQKDCTGKFFALPMLCKLLMGDKSFVALGHEFKAVGNIQIAIGNSSVNVIYSDMRYLHVGKYGRDNSEPNWKACNDNDLKAT